MVLYQFTIHCACISWRFIWDYWFYICKFACFLNCLLLNLLIKAQRRSAKFFSIVVWICCVLSFIKYIISLVLMIVYRQNMINTCIRSGLVGIGNSQSGLVPTTVSTGSYYSPVKYPDTMNTFASSQEDCEKSIQLMIILWGAIIFAIQVLQVNININIINYKD